MKAPATVDALEKFGRIRLSESFFMRDFLYSDISMIEGIPNIPDNPDLAIEVGEKLCQEVLEPIQQAFGRISIRSAYRSCALNAKGAENKNQYNCSSNESNYAKHIWDRVDASGNKGAMACIVVNRFIPLYEENPANWQALAWWIHDNVPGYASLYFFPKLCAFNIGWRENAAKSIRSYIEPKKALVLKGEEVRAGDYRNSYQDVLKSLLVRSASVSAHLP